MGRHERHGINRLGDSYGQRWLRTVEKHDLKIGFTYLPYPFTNWLTNRFHLFLGKTIMENSGQKKM